MTWRIPNTILAEVAPASYEKPSIHGAITNQIPIIALIIPLVFTAFPPQCMTLFMMSLLNYMFVSDVC